jgi:hypothetical protein
MKKSNWLIWVAGVLILSSAVLYVFHWLIFRDYHHIFIYMVGDIAFLPVEVLLVTLVIHRLLSQREKRALLQKMNMVIGAFFGEVGADLLDLLAGFDEKPEAIRGELIVEADWSDQRFRKTANEIKGREFAMDATRGDLEELREFLSDKQNFLLRLLENPNLLEHDSFTDLLWAVFHLADELVHRDDVSGLPASDYGHLTGDIKRVYGLLIAEWLDYMNYLKGKYPYLFSLAVRTNPFDAAASVVVGE